MAAKSSYTDELQAMGGIMEALSPLDREAKVSVLKWVLAKLELSEEVSGVPQVKFADLPDAGSSSQTRAGTINTVASKLGADSCRTLLIAAAVHLALYQGKESFTRAELVSLARSAKVWKADYTNQTSTMIGRLADAGVIVEKSRDTYFLADGAAQGYQAELE